MSTILADNRGYIISVSYWKKKYSIGSNKILSENIVIVTCFKGFVAVLNRLKVVCGASTGLMYLHLRALEAQLFVFLTDVCSQVGHVLLINIQRHDRM